MTNRAMPFADIRLLFETLVQRTRTLCKCEMWEIGSELCNFFAGTFSKLRGRLVDPSPRLVKSLSPRFA